MVSKRCSLAARLPRYPHDLEVSQVGIVPDSSSIPQTNRHLFNGYQVLPILYRSQTQTRRVLKVSNVLAHA